MNERCKLKGFEGAELCHDECEKAGRCLKEEVPPPELLRASGGGGSAFPTAPRRQRNGSFASNGAPGMTLRDYFAGQALIASAGYSRIKAAEEVAKFAYEVADAMLEERDR